tara:strand:- start:133 stop:276 length:144 start_codon:yes stop_codon:yes gene_type:complete
MIVKIEIIEENEQGERSSASFDGDDLTSPISEALEFLKAKQEAEMVV